MRRYLRITLITLLLCVPLSAAWAAEAPERYFLDDLGKTVVEIMELYGAPELRYGEEAVLGFAYKDMPLQGRLYDVTYFIMGHRAVGLNYKAHKVDELSVRGDMQWFETYMGKNNRELMDMLGIPDAHMRIFQQGFFETMDYTGLNFEGRIYSVQFALEDDAVFGIYYDYKDPTPLPDVRAFVLDLDARVLYSLNNPAWVLNDSSWNPNRPPDEDRWLYARTFASNPYNAWFAAIVRHLAGTLTLSMTFHDRTAPGPYAQAAIAADDEAFRQLLDREEEMRRLAQTDESYTAYKDFDWSRTRGNVEKLQTLPNYTEPPQP